MNPKERATCERCGKPNALFPGYRHTCVPKERARSTDFIEGQKDACRRLLTVLQGSIIERQASERITDEVRRILNGD